MRNGAFLERLVYCSTGSDKVQFLLCLFNSGKGIVTATLLVLWINYRVSTV